MEYAGGFTIHLTWFYRIKIESHGFSSYRREPLIHSAFPRTSGLVKAFVPLELRLPTIISCIIRCAGINDEKQNRDACVAKKGCMRHKQDMHE